MSDQYVFKQIHSSQGKRCISHALVETQHGRGRIRLCSKIPGKQDVTLVVRVGVNV